MTPDTRVTVHRGPAIMTYPDGSRWTMERTATHHDIWWDTPVGRINFGRAIISGPRLVRVDDDG